MKSTFSFLIPLLALSSAAGAGTQHANGSQSGHFAECVVVSQHYVAALWLFAQAPTLTQAQALQVRDQINTAKALYKSGDVNGAIQAFEKLDKADPGNAEIEAWLGFVYLQGNRAKEAILPLQLAQKARPTDLEVNTNLGGAYLGAGELDKALAQYLSVEKMAPKLPQIPYNVGTIYLQLKKYPEAANAFQRALSLTPRDPFALNNLGIALERVGQKVPAAKTYSEASEIKPSDATFARNAGFAWYSVTDFERASHYLARAQADGIHDTELSLNLADCYTRLKRRDEALKVYASLEESEKAKAPYWFNVGVLKDQQGDSLGAEAAYRQAYALDANDLDTLNNLGMLLYKHGNYAEAETLFDRLSGLNGSSQSAWHNLAASATRAGDRSKAITAWKAALKLNPGAVQDRLELANLFLESNDLKDAGYNYNQVLLLQSSRVEALNGLGLVSLRATKLPAAEGYFRRAIEVNKHFIPAYNNLALTLEKRNHRKEAILLLKLAAKLAPQDTDVQKNLQRMLAASA